MTRNHSVSETGRETPAVLCPLERANLIHWTTDPVSRNIVFSGYFEFRIVDKVLKPSDSPRYYSHSQHNSTNIYGGGGDIPDESGKQKSITQQVPYLLPFFPDNATKVSVSTRSHYAVHKSPRGGCGSVVVQALCYKPEGRGFETP
jgi:hypothetical protein